MKPFTVCLLAALMIATASPVRAQQPPAAPKPAMVPLDVEVVISRYQGDRKISSMPYTLNVNANGEQTTLAMGTEVPVPSTTVAPAAQTGQSSAPVRSYNYRNVGTNIVLRASSAGDGLFQLQVNLTTARCSARMPVSRQFR